MTCASAAGPWAPTVCANLLRPLLLDVAAPHDAAARAPHRLRACCATRPTRSRRLRRAGPRGARAPALRGEWSALLLARRVRTSSDALERRDPRRRLRRPARRPRASSASCRHSRHVTLVYDTTSCSTRRCCPGAAAGTLEPRHVVVPLREELHRTRHPPRPVIGADPRAQARARRPLEGRRHELPYDQLIVALGSTSRTLPIPGLAEHGVGFKTLSEAIALRNRLISSLERAELRTTRRPAARCSPTSSSAPATRAWRASPSCRTSRATWSSATRAAAWRACASSSSRRATG